jgi:hypothetical protein
VITNPFFWEIDALIAISIRPAGRKSPNNITLATASVSKSTTELDVTPRPGATAPVRAALDKIVSSHQAAGGPIVYLPQACDNMRGSGVHKPSRQPYQPFAFNLLAQSGLAGAQRHQRVYFLLTDGYPQLLGVMAIS